VGVGSGRAARKDAKAQRAGQRVRAGETQRRRGAEAQRGREAEAQRGKQCHLCASVCIGGRSHYPNPVLVQRCVCLCRIRALPRSPPFPWPLPPRGTLMVKSGQGLAQRRKDAKGRAGDGVYHQSHVGGKGKCVREPISLDGRGVWGAGEKPLALDGRGVGERVTGLGRG
jgi:hypothetical protein